MKRLEIPEAFWPGSLENLFPTSLRAQAVDDGILRLSATPHDELLSSEWYPRISPYLSSRTDPGRFHILSADPLTKLAFARWIVARPAEEEVLEPLRPVVEGMHEILFGPLVVDETPE